MSFLVKYITRFTEDCFASIVAVMFIMDAFKSTIGIYSEYPTKIGNKFFEKSLDFECICNKTTNSSFIIDKKIMFQNLNETLSNDIIDDNGFVVGCSLNGTEFKCKELGPEKLYPDIFVFSLLLFLLTFSVCLILKNIRDKNYFPKKVFSCTFDLVVAIYNIELAILFIRFDK